MILITLCVKFHIHTATVRCSGKYSDMVK
jgi:hypothetical protein